MIASRSCIKYGMNLFLAMNWNCLYLQRHAQEMAQMASRPFRSFLLEVEQSNCTPTVIPEKTDVRASLRRKRVSYYYFRMLAQSYTPNLYTPPLYYNFFIILSPLFFATVSIPIRFEPRIRVSWTVHISVRVTLTQIIDNDFKN